MERYVPAARADDLAGRLRRATSGMRVTWLGSIVLDREDAWLCLFRAELEADVVEANRRAGASFDRVVDATLVGWPEARV